MEEVAEENARVGRASSRLFGFRVGRKGKVEEQQEGFLVERGRIVLDPAMRVGNAAEAKGAYDPAEDPDVVLNVFAAMARTGCTLGTDGRKSRLSQALPLLSAHMEEGPTLWRQLQAVLTEPYAGDALRTMHALGMLELLIPEFHGIDALVIRDAYHRYTVDEHTFVLVDTLHGLARQQEGSLGGVAGAIWDGFARVAASGTFVPGGAAARYGQGAKYWGPCGGGRADGAGRVGAPGTGCIREWVGAGADRESS